MQTSITTRVHGELLVLDYFSRKKLEFVDDDKYIGCSKPACYFCYKWISLHHGGFSLPASHKKVILGCRGPDVDATKDINGNGARIWKEMYERITKEIARDIEDQILIEQSTTAPRHLSSNGSSRAPSVITIRSILQRFTS